MEEGHAPLEAKELDFAIAARAQLSSGRVTPLGSASPTLRHALHTHISAADHPLRTTMGPCICLERIPKAAQTRRPRGCCPLFQNSPADCHPFHARTISPTAFRARAIQQ